jgi:hypothetical protein
MPGPVRVAVTKLSPCNFKDTVKNSQFLQNINYLNQAMQGVFHKQRSNLYINSLFYIVVFGSLKMSTWVSLCRNREG